MGKYRKTQPTKLAQKLLSIRRYFDFTQEQMIGYVMPDAAPTIARAALSDFESGKRVPSLLEILNYAKAARFLTVHKDFNVEILLDDKLALPFRCFGSNGTQSAEKEKPVQSVNLSISSNDKVTALIEPDQAIGESSSTPKMTAQQIARTDEIKLSNLEKVEPVKEKILPVNLSGKTLTKIDDIRLELLKDVPYYWRAQFDLTQFIEVILGSVAADHCGLKGKSAVIEEIREMIAELPDDDE